MSGLCKFLAFGDCHRWGTLYCGGCPLMGDSMTCDTCVFALRIGDLVFCVRYPADLNRENQRDNVGYPEIKLTTPICGEYKKS